MRRIHEKEIRYQAKAGAIELKTIVFFVLVIGIAFFVLRAFFVTAKVATATVSDRNQKVIEQKKALVTEQAERLKNVRDATAAP